MENQIIFGRGDWELERYPTIGEHYVGPVIVTPNVYKSKRFNDSIFRNILLPIWEKASMIKTEGTEKFDV